MNKIIKNILIKIEEEGFEAYLVGGFVRDYLLGINTNDIDICTNALPKDLHKIFSNDLSNNYGGFNLNIEGYNIDITTYRKELKYDRRKPTEFIYVDKLEADIIRRDFTINSICMDKDEKIIDLLGGVKDLNDRKIKMIGSISERLEEDPLRILRAVRLSTTLDFDIDEKLYKHLLENYQLVNTLSKIRIKQELNKILLNKNFLKGLKLLKDLKILDILEIDFDEITYVSDICGMWAQLKTENDFAFTKQEITNIINIREIVSGGVINNGILYKYGLYNSLVAAKILNIDNLLINNMYDKLPIKCETDLDITTKEILDILNISPSKVIKDIKNELIKEILNNKLKNKNEDLVKYILNRKDIAYEE